MDSNVFSQIMSQIPSRNRAYSLSQALEMGENCLSLVLDSRIHTFIPAEIFDLKNLLVLSLQGIPIDHLDDSISKLSHLKVLNLLECGIQQLPECIVDLPLEVLWLSDGVWDFIPELILELKNVKSLVIDNYGIHEIPDSISKCSLLEEISFKDNLIQKIPHDFYSLISLKTIFFSNNKITALDDRVGDLVDIRKIDFNHNSISNIPNTIGQLTRIHFLDFSFNKLENIPTSISRCHLLSNLFLNNNSIANIPKEIFSLPISYFNISKNKLKEIHPFIENCRRLRFLDISNNELIDLPKEINQLKQLEEVNLNKNNIEYFPTGILGLDKIKKIRGWSKLLNPDLRKHIIPFIQSAYKNKISFADREELFSLFIQTKILNKKEAIRLLNSGFRPFKIKAINILEEEIISSEIKNILFLGKFKSSKTFFHQNLIQKNIKISTQHKTENTHIVLGSGQYNSKINDNWKGTFITENTLIKILDIKQEEHDYILSNSATENIKRLLSSNETNLELALQLLENKDIPTELISIIYFIMISNHDSSIRIKARNLIKHKIDFNLIKYSKKDFNKEYQINLILENISKNSNIKNKEIAYHLFNSNNKAWLFIYNNYDSFIFNKFKGNHLNLSFAALNKIPQELKSISSFKSIDLSNNELKEITINDIEKLNNFSEIDLSKNPLESICPELLQLSQLRILKIRSCPNIDYSNKAAWITVFK